MPIHLAPDQIDRLITWLCEHFSELMEGSTSYKTAAAKIKKDLGFVVTENHIKRWWGVERAGQGKPWPYKGSKGGTSRRTRRRSIEKRLARIERHLGFDTEEDTRAEVMVHSGHPKDLARLYEGACRLWDTHLGQRPIEDPEHTTHRLFYAIERNVVVAAGTLVVGRNGDWWMRGDVVDPSSRGLGIHKALIAARVARVAKRKRTEGPVYVRARVCPAARPNYEKQGFKTTEATGLGLGEVEMELLV